MCAVNRRRAAGLAQNGHPRTVPPSKGPSKFNPMASRPLGMPVIVMLVLAILTVGIARAVEHSRIGRGLQAIRDNEQRAVSLGYEADRYKLLAFILSAALAGLAGVYLALVLVMH